MEWRVEKEGKWKMVLTVTSDDRQGLLDFMNTTKYWKRFKHIHYVDHRIGSNPVEKE